MNAATLLYPLAVLLCAAAHCAVPTSVELRAGDELLSGAPVAKQRAFIWGLWSTITAQAHSTGRPAFEGWHSDSETFSAAEAPGGRDANGPPRHLAPHGDLGAPVITRTWYNEPAYRHVRERHLYLRAEMESLRRQGPFDRTIPSNRSVPEFPHDSVVLKTVWWPVARLGLTPLPVWRNDRAETRKGGRGYLSWDEFVLVSPKASNGLRAGGAHFAGHWLAEPQQVDLSSFYHVPVDSALAKYSSHDSSAAKVAAIVLGRPLEAGDVLILVGVNLASHVTEDWAWAALWWSDRPTVGPFATDRPENLRGWQGHFVMSSTFGSNLPVEAGGDPHVCFNPWLEARFPDGGFGSGTESNCVACHRRATYPPVNFLPVTRGNPDFLQDPAYAAGLVRTSSLWGLALRPTHVDKGR